MDDPTKLDVDDKVRRLVHWFGVSRRVGSDEPFSCQVVSFRIVSFARTKLIYNQHVVLYDWAINCLYHKWITLRSWNPLDAVDRSCLCTLWSIIDGCIGVLWAKAKVWRL